MVRIIAIRERAVPLSRFAPKHQIAGAGLDTSAVAVVSDVMDAGGPVVGYGFGSFGRHSVGGLIRGRFGHRLLHAPAADEVDPLALWQVMMAGEKPGGHGERCVAVGSLDMALWDLAGRLAREPVHHVLARRLGQPVGLARVKVYAGGGYRYPDADPVEDRRRLADETRAFLDLGHTRVKIKIGDGSPDEDAARIDAVMPLLEGPHRLAVDAMNRYSPHQATTVAGRLREYGLGWWEDVCDPLDFQAQAAVAAAYPPPLAAGEALFSVADARNLLRYGGLRPDRDRLVFDPVHCYGVPGYLGIVAAFEQAGWSREAFWPHGGHLFSLHLAAALGLGGSELNPLAFQPFSGLGTSSQVRDGTVHPPDDPGIGWESEPELADLFHSLT